MSDDIEDLFGKIAALLGPDELPPEQAEALRHRMTLMGANLFRRVREALDSGAVKVTNPDSLRSKLLERETELRFRLAERTSDPTP